MAAVLHAIYQVQAEAAQIEARARAIALEQSVEMPLAAIDDPAVLAGIVGRVEAIEALAPGRYRVEIALALATIGDDPGQLLNMLFGNSSLHDDVILEDARLPAGFEAAFGGPRHGLAGLRARVGAGRRALTCSALKPQGLGPERLADLARRFAQGGLDYVKDDHGLAEQASAPFAARVRAIAAALRAEGAATRYAPSLSGDLDRQRWQLALATAEGIDTVLAAPMIVGLANFATLVRDHPGIAFMTHPTMAGAARIAPPFLFGKLFRMLGADAVVFPNHGGRFGYSATTCRALAEAALAERAGLRPAVPVPAGGMATARVPEMLDFYGPDVMLLIGGGLLEARARLAEASAAFVAAVKEHGHG